PWDRTKRLVLKITPTRAEALKSDSGGQGLIFVVVNFKNLQQSRKLQNFARGGAQAEQDEARINVAAGLEPFDHGSDAGAIDIADLAEIHDHARGALLANLAQKGFAHLRRVGQVYVPRDVEDRGVIAMPRGNLHEALLWVIKNCATASI